MDRLAQGQLEPSRQRRGLVVRQGALLGGILHIEFGLLGGRDALGIELAQTIHHELVDRIIHEQHLKLAGPEHLEVRTRLGGGPILGQQVINVLLALRHPLHIVGHRRLLAGLRCRGLVAHEFGQGGLVLPVAEHALFEEPVVLGVKPIVSRGILLGLFGQMLEEAIGQRLAQLAHEVGVLHPLAGDIERQVFAVHHTAHEAQPLRQESLGLGLDEHLAAIEMNFRLLADHAGHFQTARRHKEQRLNGDGRIGREMQAVLGWLVVMGEVLVELLIFLLLHLVLRTGPNGLHRVDPLAVQFQREGHEVGVPLDDAFQVAGLREFLGFVLEAEGDLSARGGVRSRLERVAIATLAGPFPTLGAGRLRAGYDRHLLGHHEGGIKADTKLADEPGVWLLLLGQSLEEGLGARVRDGPQVLDELVPVHANARVGDGQRRFRLVGGDGDGGAIVARG